MELALVNPHKMSVKYNFEAIDRLLDAGSSIDPMRIPVQDRHALWPNLTPPHLLDSKEYIITKAIPTIPPDLAAELEAARPHDIPERPGIVFDPSGNLLSDVVRKGMNGLLARLLEVGMAESADAKLNALVEAVRASTAEAVCNDDGGATPS